LHARLSAIAELPLDRGPRNGKNVRLDRSK